jgi:epsilon-lactone hydrolase
MSLRAELVRLGLRWSMKRGNRHGTLAEARRRLIRLEALIPHPPPGTKTERIDAGGVDAVRIATPVSRTSHHVLFLHGGAFMVGSSASYRHVTWRIASATMSRVLSVNYRLAPEHPFPAALEDSVAAYRSLLDEGTDPRRIAVMGDSAGGGLVFAMLLKLRDGGTPLPAASVALSPWTDLALTGASIRLLADADPMVGIDHLATAAEYYLSGADPRTPYASPLYGDPAGLPPTLIQVGSDEVLRDDAIRMAGKMRAAGCRVESEIWPRMPHVWHLFAPILPEARRAIARIGVFVCGEFARSAGTAMPAPRRLRCSNSAPSPRRLPREIGGAGL